MKQSFEIAVEDDLLRKNPCNNALKLSKSCVSLEKLNERDYLSKEEEDRLVKFLLTESDSFTISVLTITILNTGLRIGEITVLQWDDCDFARNVISVNKTQIRYRSKETGKEAYMIKSPKSISGIRTVPMLPIVKQLLLELREEQRAKKLKSPTSMGYNNYVFFSKRGAVFHANMFYNALRRKIKQYNEYEDASAIQEQRAPCYMPFVSAHDLRRTFATRLNENNVNPKIMQTILGHSNVQTTWSKYIKTSEDLTEEQYLNVLASSSFISSMNTSLDASCDSTQPLASQNKQTNTLSGFGDLSNHQLISPNAKSNSGMDFTNNLPSSDGKL